MSASELEGAKRETIRARASLDTTLVALQQRLHPKSLATGAWEGVRDKGSDLADDALQVVKDRPATVSVALAAFAVFLARDPLRKAVTRIFSGTPEDEGQVTTHVDTQETKFKMAAPYVAPAPEGVNS